MEAYTDILRQGERVLLEGRASRQLFGGLYLRGQLILTDRRFLYLPQNRVGRVRLLLGSLALPKGGFHLNNSAADLLQITTTRGKTYRFLLRRGERRRWQEALEWALLLRRRRDSPGQGSLRRL